MTKQIFKMLIFVAVIATFSSCSTFNHNMREPDIRVELTKSDFTLSNQVSAEAKSIKIIGIDFKRLLLFLIVVGNLKNKIEI